MLRQDLAQELFHELSCRRGGVSPEVLHTFRGCRLYAVDLSHCQGLDDTTAAAVVAEHACALQSLSLLGGVALGDAVCSALRDCMQLRTLTLSGCAALTDSCITYLQGCGRLEHLDLSGCAGISNAGIAALARCHCLRSLDVSRCRRVSDLSPLAALPLRALVLGWTAVDDMAMADVALMCGLETLVLDRTGVTDQGVMTACGACTRLSLLSLSGCAATGAIGAALAPLRCLREVSLAHTRFSDTGIASWCSQPQPQMWALSLSHTAVTSTSLLALGQAMGGLEVLNLDGCRTGGEALRHLNKLRRLNVADTLVTDADMEHICSLPALEALNLAFCSVTGSSLRRFPLPTTLKCLDLDTTRGVTLAELVHLPLLEQLTLPDGQTDVSIVLLSRFSGTLTTLEMSSSGVTDAGVAHIAKLGQLRRLSMPHSKVTDGSLALLCASLPQLQTLNLSGTVVTDSGLQTLVDSAPESLLSVILIKTSVTEAAARRAAESRPSMRVSIGHRQQHRLRAEVVN